jgi:hypothetical protein
MPAYDNNKPEHSQINLFKLAGRTTNLVEHEPLNNFESINPILLASEEPREDHVWAELHPVSPWNNYWNEAAKYRGGLKIDYPVLKDNWTKYFGLHINCDEKEECFCEHHCGGTHTTTGRTVSSSEQTSCQFPTVSEMERAAVPDTTPAWTHYQQRKLDKGKDIKRNLHSVHPVLQTISLSIITQTDGHEEILS